ncbi:hypothetical protein RND81_04G109300 [Saponaria officinalis]|uniref:GRF-type domain-containing protein n=1 Tax=Saponaria officinalis TaxID=3572 RepID=A0AAW1LDK5_SAPOF
MSQNSETSRSHSSEGPNKCLCGAPVAMLKSWTNNNPGRRFETCKFYNLITKTRGCKYFRWVDYTHTTWQKDVINQLLIEKGLLRNEVEILKSEVSNLQEVKKNMKSEIEELSINNPKVVNQNFKTRNVCYTGCYVIVIVIVYVLAMLSMYF